MASWHWRIPHFIPNFESVGRKTGSLLNMSRSSLALGHARGLAILLVVCVHSALAYLQNQPVSVLPFAEPPYAWRVVPIVDQQHWLG